VDEAATAVGDALAGIVTTVGVARARDARVGVGGMSPLLGGRSRVGIAEHEVRLIPRTRTSSSFIGLIPVIPAFSPVTVDELRLRRRFGA
jgi:hypothetical protein